MKKLLAAICLLCVPHVLADDVALAKETFGKFVEYQKADDPRLLDQFTADASGQFAQSDGTLRLTTMITKDRFRKGIEAGLEKKAGHAEPYEEVEFKASKNNVSAHGFIHYSKPDFKGPFSAVFIKDAAGALKIRYMEVTLPLVRTPIKSHGLFEFVMPGEWKPADGKKADLGGKTMYPGRATGQNGGLAYFAFEDPGTKTADQPLENFPWKVAQPIFKKLEESGAKEENRFFDELTAGNPDQAYFVYTLKGPDGSRISINGMVLRTKARVYVIQTVGPVTPNVDLWQEVAKSFKEL